MSQFSRDDWRTNRWWRMRVAYPKTTAKRRIELRAIKKLLAK
jgi:hypothetical protein